MRALALALGLILSVACLVPSGYADEAKFNANDAAEAFDEGEALREEGKWEDAGQAYWSAIEADARHYRAHVRYQDASLQSGRSVDELVADYEALIVDYPNIAALKLHRARLTAPAKRIDVLEAARKADPASFDALVELGRAHLALGETDKATRHLTKAFSLAPADRVDVLFLLAEAQVIEGKEDAAIKKLESAVAANPQLWLGHLTLARIDLVLGDFESAQKRSETVLQQRPSYVAAFLIRSEALVGQDKTTEALKVLQAAHRIASESPDVLVALGDLTARSGEEKDLKAALPFYKTVLEQNEEHLHALYGNAWAHERLKEYDKAEDGYRAVALINPKSVEAVNSIGYVLLKQGRVSEAQAQFKRALDMNEDYVTALANLGSTYDAQSKWGDAIKVYEQILKMKGHKDNLRALINCAFDYEALTSYNKAVKLLERAHNVVPDDPNICVWIGDNLYFQKRWSKAEKWYKKAVRLDEKSYFAWRGLGWALAHQKKWQDAINALEKAVSLNAEEKDVLINIGDIHLSELKDIPKAIEAYERYVGRGGDDPVVLETLDSLRAELGEDDDG